MYLKSIEVQGFKSFANKIKFDFHNGITGIVGPNGSGKSNVADAVRWVLGEQRVKQLRGGSMQDVIFSGTENRRPLSYASVAITLDNSDHKLPVEFEEVTVTRKLYRSGESEYLINGAACRLKDINEMFYDTGIGKEGYSIIGQGQIDKILSGKPEERRELFDEAAGIVKFKRLKKKEELKVVDINMFLLEEERLRERIRETAEKYENASSEMETSSARYEEMKAEYERIEEEVEEIDLAIENAKNQLNETNLLKQQLEGQINVLKEQINTARMNDEHYDRRLSTIRGEIDAKAGQRKAFEEERDEVQRKLAEVSGQDKEAAEQLIIVQTRIAENTAAIESGKQEIMELLGNRASTKAKIQHYDTTREQIASRKAVLARNILEISSEAEEQNDSLRKYEAELKSVRSRIAECSRRIAEDEDEIERLRKELADKQEKLKIGQTAYQTETGRRACSA